LAIVSKNHVFKGFLKSKYALALPVTFLILLVSTLCMVAITYSYAIERINSQSQTLKVATAKQSFLSLDDDILSTLWQPGSSGTFELSDSGGIINVQPNSTILTIGISDRFSINETIFNASIGKIKYELPYSGSSDLGLFLKGDSRTIVNQTGSSLSRLSIENGDLYHEIQLRYRPSVSYSNGGIENGKIVNNIRLYIINLNSSQSIKLHGDLPLKISCTNIELTTTSFDVPYQFSELLMTSQLDGFIGSVSIPISSTPEGSIIKIETVISNVSIERVIL